MADKQVLNASSSSQGDDERRRRNEEEIDNRRSDSENEEPQPRRNRYHRHSIQQIHQMESFFKECPHPDEQQRRELGRQLGMEPLQIKFWFQNKRTQMKMQHEHEENKQLRSENERLRAENMRLREALNNACCFHCGASLSQPSSCFLSPDQKGENYPMEGPSSCYADVRRSIQVGGGGYKSVVMEVGRSAMEELMRVAQMGEPLWVPTTDPLSCALNHHEYMRLYSTVLPHCIKSEASRASLLLPINAANLAHIFMDVEQWANVFSGVVARANILQLISSGLAGTCNEAMQVMKVEYQVPSPVVPTRESHFLRHCRLHVDGTWAVVDVSLGHLQPTTLATCRRRPSGCLIRDMPNGHSKIIWVEHVEVQDGGGHSIYKPLIMAGLAFGARRWVAILDAYCQRLARTILLGREEGRKSMLGIAERMVTRFCRLVNTSTMNTWTTLSGNGGDNVKFMTRKNGDDPSLPLGVHLCVATSFWLPIPPKRVYDFVCDHNIRKEWDMLFNGGDVHEMAHVVTGKPEGNRVTIYQIKGEDGRMSEMTMLQEGRSDSTASYLVYAPIDTVSANTLLGGEGPSCVSLLPSGFAILPDGPTGGDTGGSLLTFALQVIVDPNPNADLSMESIEVANQLITCTVNKIKHTLVPRS